MPSLISEAPRLPRSRRRARAGVRLPIGEQDDAVHALAIEELAHLRRALADAGEQRGVATGHQPLDGGADRRRGPRPWWPAPAPPRCGRRRPPRRCPRQPSRSMEAMAASLALRSLSPLIEPDLSSTMARFTGERCSTPWMADAGQSPRAHSWSVSRRPAGWACQRPHRRAAGPRPVPAASTAGIASATASAPVLRSMRPIMGILLKACPHVLNAAPAP